MSVVDISALVQYNNWANRRLLDTAAHLSADQLIGMVFHQGRVRPVISNFSTIWIRLDRINHEQREYS